MDAFQLKNLVPCFLEYSRNRSFRKKPQVGTIQNTFILVLPFLIDQQVLENIKITNVGNGRHDVTPLFQEARQPAHGQPRIAQMLKDIVVYDAIEVSLREIKLVYLYVSSQHLIKNRPRLFRRIGECLHASHFNIPGALERSSKRTVSTTYIKN